MKHLIMVAVYLWIVPVAIHAQPICHFDNLENTNDFVYPESTLENTLHLGNYSAFVYGETHTEHFEPAFKCHFIKHLNSRYGVRDVFMEIGNGTAWLFNQYLATGDTSFFYPIPGYKPVYTWGYYYKDFWRELFAYNRSLPASKRIIIHGTDFERKEAFQVLLLLIPPGHSVPPNLKPVFADISNYIKDTTWKDFTKDAAAKYKRVRTDFGLFPEDVRRLYGENIGVVESIVNNAGKQQTKVPPRNKTMFKNLKRTVVADSIDKFLCFFGSAHTNYRSSSSISSQINRLAPFNGKTMNMFSLIYNVYSRRLKKIIPYAGAARNKDIYGQLYARYLTKAYRAALINASETDNKSLIRSADFILLANDNTTD